MTRADRSIRLPQLETAPLHEPARAGARSCFERCAAWAGIWVAALAASSCANTASTPALGPGGNPTAEQENTPDADIEAHVVRARELFANGDPASALVEVDQALRLAPTRADLLIARADGLVLLARNMAARGENGMFVISTFEDALRSYEHCAPSPRVLLGRCRATTGLGRSEAAWALAEQIEALPSDPPVESPLATREEIVAQAAYIACVDALVGALAPGSHVPDFATTQALVAEYVASARDRVDAWEMLTNLYLFRASVTDDSADTRRALDTVLVALQHLPEEPALTKRMLELAYRVGGASESATVTAAYADRYADSAAARLQAARALFDLAIAEFPGPDADAAAVALGRERLERVEEWLVTAGELDPDGYESATLGWRAVARIARGWVDYYAGELDLAKSWFLSANDVFPRGIEWSIEGAVQSGVQGLYAIATRHQEQGQLLEAARVAARLHELLPNDPNFANNAGLLHRDVAVALEEHWRELLKEGDARADDALAAAWNHMRASAAAYRRAAELLPEDVRIVNDAALVYAYYLHEEIDWAEDCFRRMIALGETQLADPSLTEQQRFDLLNAWGDAHENLAVLLLEHRGDPDGARHWFTRAVEIGPAPRPMITDVWMARLDGRIPAGEEPYTILDWGRPRE